MASQKYMFQIMVPCEMDAKPVRKKHHQNWDSFVYNIAGGITILKPATGKWISPSNEKHEERVIPVNVCCTEKQILRIVDFTIKHYRQLAVLYFKLGEAHIVHASDKID